MTPQELFGQQKISRILLKLAPPVMFSQLIQALYNIVDSFFIGRGGESGLTALSIIYPVQLLMIALAVGTGVGINTAMAMKMGRGRNKESEKCSGMATPLAMILWGLFALAGFFLIPAYARLGTATPEVINDVIVYGRIVCIFSFGLFLESGWTKVLQSEGNMRLPMLAQIIGAAVNIALDPLLIFGLGFFPALGIEGAAYATVIGQIAAALVVMKKGFRRPPKLSFFTMVTSLMFPVVFQALGFVLKSSFLTVLRTVILFVPLGYVFSRLGLDFFWLTFPITESLTSAAGLFFYAKWTKKEVLKISVF